MVSGQKMRVELDYPPQTSLTEGQYQAEISQRDVEKHQWSAEQLAGQQKAFKGHGPTRQPQTPQALEKKKRIGRNINILISFMELYDFIILYLLIVFVSPGFLRQLGFTESLSRLKTTEPCETGVFYKISSLPVIATLKVPYSAKNKTKQGGGWGCCL